MDTFWIKLGIFGAIIAGAVFLVMSSQKSIIKDVEKNSPSFSEQVEKDDARLREAPKPLAKPEPRIKETEKTGTEQKQQETMPVQNKVATTKRSVPQFRKLSETEDIEAQRLFEVAIKARSMGRLPGTGFKLMVDTCRQLIQKFPGTIYEYKAKRMMGEMPERFWPRYKVTKDEVIIE